MPNIAEVIKAEISRLARKEVRSESEALKRQVASYRKEIASLKRRVADLERRFKPGSRGAGAAAPVDAGSVSKRVRFSASRFAAHRQKLGLSASEYARLLGVSPLSIYKWEKGQVRPRPAQLQAIAQARALGKREARQRLQVLQAAS